MQRIAVLMVFLAATSILVAAPPPEKLAPVSPAFEISIDVHPSSSEPYQLLRRTTPSTYTCTATVTTPGTTSLHQSQIIAEPGTPEETRQKFGDGFQLKFNVSVSRTGNEARAVAEISRDGQILARQSSQILLQRPEKSR